MVAHFKTVIPATAKIAAKLPFKVNIANFRAIFQKPPFETQRHATQRR